MPTAQSYGSHSGPASQLFTGFRASASDRDGRSPAEARAPARGFERALGPRPVITGVTIETARGWKKSSEAGKGRF